MLMVEQKRADRFNQRKDYIDGLNMMLAPLRGFDSIEYTRASYLNNKEYVRMADIVGNVMFFDISGLSLAQVLKDIAKSLLLADIEDPAIVPESLINDYEEKMEVAELFKEERQ